MVIFTDSCTPRKIPASSHSLRITLRVELKLLLYESLPAYTEIKPCQSKEQTWTCCLYGETTLPGQGAKLGFLPTPNQFLGETAPFKAERTQSPRLPRQPGTARHSPAQPDGNARQPPLTPRLNQTNGSAGRPKQIASGALFSMNPTSPLKGDVRKLLFEKS